MNAIFRLDADMELAINLLSQHLNELNWIMAE